MILTCMYVCIKNVHFFKIKSNNDNTNNNNNIIYNYDDDEKLNCNIITNDLNVCLLY